MKNLFLDIVDDYNLVNIKDLMVFICFRGVEFGILNMNDVKDIVLINFSVFRLWFEGNY